MAALVGELGLEGTGPGSAVHGLRRLVACGIFPNQGPPSCPWHWQVDSPPPGKSPGTGLNI